MDATGSALGAFYLRSGDGKSFVHVASIGAIRELREPFDADTFEGEFGTALATERICHIKDIPEETRFVFKTVAGRRSRKRS